MARPKAQIASLMSSAEDIEAQFYEALQQGDIEKLMSVWADDDDIFCVSPGGARVVGAAAIRNVFEAIFANGAVPVRAEHVRRVTAEGSAVHSGLVRVQISTEKGLRPAWIVVTNVYQKTIHGWRLVAHHASPGVFGDAPESGETPSTLH